MKKALAFASAFFNEAHLRCMNNEAGLRPMKRGFSARRRKRGRFSSCSPKANVSRQRSCRFMFAEQTLHSFYCRGGYYPPPRAGGGAQGDAARKYKNTRPLRRTKPPKGAAFDYCIKRYLRLLNYQLLALSGHAYKFSIDPIFSYFVRIKLSHKFF